MKLVSVVKNMEIDFRKTINQQLKNGGDIEFDTPVKLNESTFITRILKDGLCEYLDEFGNEGQLETRDLNLYDLAIILDDIQGN